MVRTTRLAAHGASIAAVFAGMAANPILARHMPVFEKPNDQGSMSEAEFKSAVANLKNVTDEVKGFAEKANTEIKNLGKVTDETKEAADKALTDMNNLSARVEDMEQKLARRPGRGDGDQVKSIGQQFTASDGYKEAAGVGERWRGRVNVECKAITSASASGASSTTALVPADRQGGIVMIARTRNRVRDLLMKGRTSSASIEWVRQTTRTNSAAFVAENPSVPKPQSDMTFDQVNTPVRTLAHFVMASKQILADAPQLESIIDGELREGLDDVEDAALLKSDGSNGSILGLVPQATAYAKPAGTTVVSATMIDVLRLAILQAELSEYPASGIILNPIDWFNIEVTKNGQGDYIFANPHGGLASPTLWGLSVVTTKRMTAGQFLTGGLDRAQIFDREDTNVLMSTEDRDNFVKNMVTVLAEKRLALVVRYPQALITGSVTPPSS